MIFGKGVDFNMRHVAVYYFTFVLILSLFSILYFFESKNSTTGFIVYSETECNYLACPYYPSNTEGYDLCVLGMGVSDSSFCRWCLLIYGCANYSPDKFEEGPIEEQSSRRPILSSRPTSSEIEGSNSFVLQSTSTSAYVEDVFENYLLSSGGSIEENLFVSPICSDSSDNVECTKDILVLADKKLGAAENLIKFNLKESNDLLQKYPGDKQLIKDNIIISNELLFVQDKYSQVKSYLSLVTNVLIEEAKESANQEIMQEKQKQEVLEYYGNLGSKIPKIPNNFQPKTYTVSNSINLPKNKLDECSAPVQDMVYNSVKSGFYGIDDNGEACVKTAPSVKPYLPPKNNGIISASNGNLNPPTNLPISPSNSGNSGNGRNNAVGVFLIDNRDNLEYVDNHEAFLISRDSNDLIKIGFLLAPSHLDLEKKIADFTRELFFGESESSPVEMSGASSLVQDSFKEYSRPVPWVLWVILLFITVPFIILGRLLSIDGKYLLSQGKNYLIKNDIVSAINNYNKIIDNYYSFNMDETDISILLSNYKNILVKFLEEKSIGYSYTDSSKIVLSDKEFSYTHFSNESRVEKIIRDTKKEIKINRKLAVDRLPIITDLYRKLDVSAQKRLAEKYEDLVYSLRN